MAQLGAISGTVSSATGAAKGMANQAKNDASVGFVNTAKCLLGLQPRIATLRES